MRGAFRRGLLRWYRQHRRDLPWRRTADPYRIWVSEIMLQQTRVETVVPYYDRWLRVFPTVESLARAPFERVHKLWEGLGYYTRARNFHATARRVAESGMPASYDGWLELPGIGPYTAAAIASIAFGEAVPVVDGNVARVLARVFGIRDNIKRPATQRALVALAGRLIPAGTPGDFNQAMMELGALVCTPAGARCQACPLRQVCVARRRGWVESLPNRGDRMRMRAVVHDVVLMRNGHRVWVERRGETGLLAGMWELPRANGAHGRELFAIRHTITNHRITLRVWEAARAAQGGSATLGPSHGTLTRSAPPARSGEGRWVNRREAARLVCSAAQRRALDRIFASVSGA